MVVRCGEEVVFYNPMIRSQSLSKSVVPLGCDLHTFFLASFSLVVR